MNGKKMIPLGFLVWIILKYWSRQDYCGFGPSAGLLGWACVDISIMGVWRVGEILASSGCFLTIVMVVIVPSSLYILIAPLVIECAQHPELSSECFISYGGFLKGFISSRLLFCFLVN